MSEGYGLLWYFLLQDPSSVSRYVRWDWEGSVLTPVSSEVVGVVVIGEEVVTVDRDPGSLPFAFSWVDK